MQIVPVRNRLAFPVGSAPGLDHAHPAARNCYVSTVARRGGNIYVGTVTTASSYDLTNKQFTWQGNSSGVHKVHSVIGPGSGATSVGDVDRSVNLLFANALPSTAIPSPCTMASIFVMEDDTLAKVMIGTANTVAGGNLFMISGNFIRLGFFGASNNDFSHILLANVPYFVAVSYNNAGTADLVITDLSTGKIRFESILVSGGPINGDASITVLNGWYGGSAFAGLVATTMLSGTRVPKSQLLAWAADPWAFWYPRQNSVDGLFSGPRISYQGVFPRRPKQLIIPGPNGPKIVG